MLAHAIRSFSIHLTIPTALHILSKADHTLLQRIYILATVAGYVRLFAHPEALAQLVFVLILKSIG
jgi:uncharacterized integral membrane protein